MIRIEPLTDEAFAEFGVPIRHPGGSERHYLPSALAAEAPPASPAVWMNSLQPPVWPLAIEKLERHTHGAQSFVPMGMGQMLVVVCGAGADGMPDPAQLRGFLCPAGTGFSYHPGTWHHGVTALGDAMDVLVIMAVHGVADETEWFTLPTPITIAEPEL